MTTSAVPRPVEEDTGWMGAATAQYALELVADGELSDAVAELEQLHDHDAVLSAVEHLTATCAAVLARVPDRSRYPIPVDYVTERFSVPSDADVGMCLTLLQRAAFRATGFEVDVEELTAAHGDRAVLLGAFHSTHAVLQFLASRWWVNPRSILDRVT